MNRRNGRKHGQMENLVGDLQREVLERAMRFELTTFTLAR